MKRYCDYLIEIYKKINIHWEDSGIYWELNQFSTEGRIKDLICKKDSSVTKIQVLNYYHDEILKFSKDKNLNMEILVFDEFEGVSI